MPEKRQNRLAEETSPYLLQHATNPVDWYPWGPEALERARTEDRPIFLSVGYAACHWCHVMERESFEDEEIAGLLNERFISIKVDREERPDIDEIYMQSVQLVTGSGGWPMSVFLTPDGRPFYGGTYFPPEDGFGRPGFRSVLLQLAEAWETRRAEVEQSADRIVEALRHALGRGGGTPGAPSAALLEGAEADLGRRFDAQDGGFSPAPKFPHADAILLLLRQAGRTGSEQARGMALRTLDAIDRGGIHDQAGGGFHRYSTDSRWLVPHFEKMLYDQALLVRAYLEAWRQTGDERWARPARRACDWVIRDMVDGDGGLHSTLDADSEGEEGKFYVWTTEDLRQVLEAAGAGEEEAIRYLRWYGVEGSPNFEGAWILHRPHSLEAFAGAEGLKEAAWLARAGELDEAVRVAREERPWPGKDDKVLAAWNGLMIGSLARAGALLDEARYRDAAAGAADFVLGTMRVDGRLRRAWRAGRLGPPAFLEDYAFLAEGLLDLNEATGDGRWLEHAHSLSAEAVGLFREEGDGSWYFTGTDGEDLLVRSKAIYDGATPAGVSVMADVMLRLSGSTGEEAWRERAVEILSGQREAMSRFPGAYSTMLLAVDRLIREEGDADLAGRAPLPAVEASAGGPVSPGGAVEVRVRVDAPEGWTLAVSEGEEGYEPLALRLAVRSGGWNLEVGETSATEADAQAESAEVAAQLTAPEDVEAGREELSLVLRYQMCGEGVCQPPAEVVVVLPVEVLA